MGTKNNPGAYDCYANAEPDEPMFVLLARDKHAPCLVWLWCALRELDGEDPAKLQEARECVKAMVEWAYGHDRKAVGLGQAALAGVCELIRAANYSADQEIAQTGRTDEEVMRLWLAQTKVAKE